MGRIGILSSKFVPKAGFKTHKCPITKEIFNIRSTVTCDTKSVIYKISCKKCIDFVYIGETGRRFRDRFTDHKGYVTRKESDKSVVGKHFNKPHHTYEHMLPMIIEHVQPSNDSFLRSRREKYWINKYQAIDYGVNKRF